MDTDKKLDWGRVVVCGLVAGLVWTVLSVTLLSIVGKEFMAAVPANRPKGGAEVFLLASNFLAGIWAMWLYAAIRPHFGPGAKTALATGLAWWIIVSLQSAKWVALGFVPTDVVWAPFAATFPSILLATLAGAWCYERKRK